MCNNAPIGETPWVVERNYCPARWGLHSGLDRIKDKPVKKVVKKKVVKRVTIKTVIKDVKKKPVVKTIVKKKPKTKPAPMTRKIGTTMGQTPNVHQKRKGARTKQGLKAVKKKQTGQRTLFPVK